jgi:prepilin-type N-terminal cleavage/methylation domain-containing protein
MMKNKLSYGFSFIEILIALLLLSIVLLGLDGMEIHALQEDRNAWFYRVAINQMEVIHEHLIALGGAEGVEQITDIWNQENRQVLPKGNGVVTGLYPLYSIKLSWDSGKKNSIQESISL